MGKISILLKALALVENWPTYIADYLGFKKGLVTYHLRNGLSYRLRAGTNDRNILNEVLFHQLYNPAGFEIKKGDMVMDIGTHVGIFSLFAAKTAEKVYSFEPMPENFTMLSENIRLNGAKNVVAVSQAVASSAGEKELFIDATNQGGHSLYTHLGTKDSLVTVTTLSLEDVFLRYGIEKVNFLKIDCEGAEYDILFHCPKEVLAKIEKISMEYHVIDESRNAVTLKKFLENNNFSVVVSDKLSMLYARHN